MVLAHSEAFLALRNWKEFLHTINARSADVQNLGGKTEANSQNGNQAPERNAKNKTEFIARSNAARK
jgi:hypothetical protein